MAILFAIEVVPLLACLGAAIDCSRANKARTAMQAALDSIFARIAQQLEKFPSTRKKPGCDSRAF